VQAELNDLDGALHQAEQGLELVEKAPDVMMLGWAYLCLMRILFSRGDLAGTAEVLQRISNSGREAELPGWARSQAEAWQARLWLAQDQLRAASQWVEERGLDADHDPPYPREAEYIALARILIVQGELNEATRLLDRLLGAAEAGGRTSRVIEILNLQSLALQAGGSMAQAIRTLGRALALAEPGGFVRTFVDEGSPMACLLYEAAGRGIAPDYAGRLLTAFEVETDGKGRTTKGEVPSSVVRRLSLVEPLSERELEVLQLIAEGLTNQEIASRLVVSLNTVKAHCRNVYGKLGVNNRTQAVVRAKAFGILPSP
jgi:LuxR family maltose regulon positive regulatory protein